MDIPPRHPFYVTIRRFMHNAQHLLKDMVVAHTKHELLTIYQCRQNRLSPVSIGVHQKHKSSASLMKTKILNSDNTVGYVHYEFLIYRAKQTKQHAKVQDRNMERLSHG